MVVAAKHICLFSVIEKVKENDTNLDLAKSGRKKNKGNYFI